MITVLRDIGLGWLLGDKDRSASRIFISYRREDARGDAGRLTDDLKESFGAKRIFRDIEAIEPGVDFIEALNRAVSLCPVLLAIIGPNWLTVKDPQGKRRLDDPNDFIRLEIGAALARNIRVIPVLVGGVGMPKAEELPSDLQSLSRRQAYELSDKRWEFDVNQLIATLETIMGPGKSTAQDQRGERPAWWQGKRVRWVAAILGLFFAAGVYSEFADDETPFQPQPIPMSQPFAQQQPFLPPAQQTVGISYRGFEAIGRYPAIVQVLNPG